LNGWCLTQTLAVIQLYRGVKLFSCEKTSMTKTYKQIFKNLPIGSLRSI